MKYQYSEMASVFHRTKPQKFVARTWGHSAAWTHRLVRMVAHSLGRVEESSWCAPLEAGTSAPAVNELGTVLERRFMTFYIGGLDGFEIKGCNLVEICLVMREEIQVW